MSYSEQIAPVAELKAQAKRLRESLRDAGTDVTHGQALNLLAQQYGMRDWNALHARAGNHVRLQVGDRVRGTYLGQAFSGQVRGISALGDGVQRRVTLQFDTPVDVVRFDSFSAFRQRVSGLIGLDGRSPQRTSDGVPQLVVMPER